MPGGKYPIAEVRESINTYGTLIYEIGVLTTLLSPPESTNCPSGGVGAFFMSAHVVPLDA